MIPLLVLCAFGLVPFLMIAIIGMAIVAKVRDGRYHESKYMLRNSPRQSAPETPSPVVAVALVMTPFAFAGLYGFKQANMTPAECVAYVAFAAIIACFVYAAAKKRRQKIEGGE
jgi:hypothetical protein